MIHPHLVFPAFKLIWIVSALITSAAWLCFRSSGRSIAEAGASALMITHIAVSIWIQIAVILGRVWPMVLLSAAMAGVAATMIWRFRCYWRSIWHGILDVLRMYSLPSAIAITAICFRAMWAACGPVDGFSLSSEAEMNTLTPAGIAFLFNSQTNLWMHTYHSLTGIMAYSAIGLSTYALSRRHAWPPSALIATMVVLSMPRLAGPVLSSANELIPAAAALFVLLSLYRIIESARIDDLLLLMLGLCCTWSVHPMGWILPSILTVLTVLLIHRRHGWSHLAQLAHDNKWLTVSAGWVAVMMSPVWNRFIGVVGQGSHAIVRYNTDGLSGAAANLVRYVLQAAHVNPVPHAAVRPVSLWWQGVLEMIYQNTIHLLGGNFGAMAKFNLSAGAGFGPLSLILVLPAVGYTLVRGPRRLRAIALAIGWYWFLLALIPAWQPGNIQLLTPLMAISAFSVASFLPPWRFSRTGQIMLNLVCLLSLCYSVLM
ncbi:MAG: hypothetical protein WA151_16575 [Desulfatirhabdiaceae bacterium]